PTRRRCSPQNRVVIKVCSCVLIPVAFIICFFFPSDFDRFYLTLKSSLLGVFCPIPEACGGKRKRFSAYSSAPVTGFAGSAPFGFAHPTPLYPFPTKIIPFFLFLLSSFVSNPSCAFHA
ncbi:unnamed protein product, partial [Tuber aestivum]